MNAIRGPLNQHCLRCIRTSCAVALGNMLRAAYSYAVAVYRNDGASISATFNLSLDDALSLHQALTDWHTLTAYDGSKIKGTVEFNRPGG